MIEISLKEISDELKKEKNCLERKIFDLILEFENQTGIKIIAINVMRMESYGDGKILAGIKSITDL